MENSKKKVSSLIISDLTLLKAQLSSIDSINFKNEVSHVQCNGLKMPSQGVNFSEEDGVTTIAFFGQDVCQGVVKIETTKFAGVRIQHTASDDVTDLSEYVIVHIINL